MWQKIKGFFRNLFASDETLVLTTILVSFYYMGLGIMLAIATKSVAILLIFAIPAIIWWAVSMTHGLVQPSYQLT